MVRRLALRKFREKKIRGLPRIAKSVNQWRRDYIPKLDIVSFLNSGFGSGLGRNHYYERILHPYDVFVGSHRQPPQGIKCKLLAGMLDIFELWKNRLADEGKEHGVMLVLFEKAFFESTVEAWYGDPDQCLSDVFSRRQIHNRFPYDQYPMLDVRLHKLQWTKGMVNVSDEEMEPRHQGFVWLGR